MIPGAQILSGSHLTVATVNLLASRGQHALKHLAEISRNPQPVNRESPVPPGINLRRVCANRPERYRVTGAPLKTYANHTAIHRALDAAPALFASGLGSYELLVLISLSRHIGRNGEAAFPSVDTIASEILCSRDSVLRALKKLTKSGFIRAVGKRQSGTKLYQVAESHELALKGLRPIADSNSSDSSQPPQPVAVSGQSVAVSNSACCSQPHEVDPEVDPEVGNGNRSRTSSGVRVGGSQSSPDEFLFEKDNTTVASSAKPVTNEGPRQPAACEVDEARALADRYFELLNRPHHHARSLDGAWPDSFRELLQRHPYSDLSGAMDWALRSSDFWPKHLHRWTSDPVEYFGQKLPIILTQWRGEQLTHANAGKKSAAATRVPATATAHRINSLLNFD